MSTWKSLLYLGTFGSVAVFIVAYNGSPSSDPTVKHEPNENEDDYEKGTWNSLVKWGMKSAGHSLARGLALSRRRMETYFQIPIPLLPSCPDTAISML